MTSCVIAGDVVRDRQQARLAADHQLVRRDGDRQFAAVAGHQFGLEVVAIAVAAQQVDQRLAIGRTFPDADLGRRPANHFVTRPAVSARETIIDVEVSAVGQARDGDRIGAEAERRAVALLAHLQGGEAAPQIGDQGFELSRARAPVAARSAWRCGLRSLRIRGGKSTHSSTSHARRHR